ncbi:hypothetical protein L484_001256 [Morus notabilis]|uniref:Uncharacterized protein n=1 Tax=Morus notabilis TaxID=981085 RepID=W9RZV3_9ROSA|nr:hypothetical protein L484_001256 [Morus notabilis]
MGRNITTKKEYQTDFADLGLFDTVKQGLSLPCKGYVLNGTGGLMTCIGNLLKYVKLAGNLTFRALEVCFMVGKACGQLKLSNCYFFF